MTRTDVFRLFSRLRMPLVLLAGAAALWYAPRAPGIDARWAEGAATIARVLVVVAMGWAVFNLGDYVLRRRLRKLKLDVDDNLAARQSATRLNVLRRIWAVVAVAITLAAALTAVPWARQIGISLFASAGIAGIVIGIAARPVLANLIAGLQVAFTQPMRLDDAVVVEGEWGWIEEIGLFHVVIRIWDWRRLVVPLTYFNEQPFQNWTRKSASIIGSVFWSLDYRAPIAAMREKLKELCDENPLWDRDVCVLQVTECESHTIQVRALASARTSPAAWDLRCDIREKMIAWLQETAPEALPRVRAEASIARASTDEPTPAAPAASQAPTRDTSLQPDRRDNGER